MGLRPPKRKSFDIEGHVHEFTFSTYRRQPFLNDDRFMRIFLKNLEKARKKHGFLVWAYVLMPEHVHLLIVPQSSLVRDILKAIKQPVTQRIVSILKKGDSVTLRQMDSGTMRGHSQSSPTKPARTLGPVGGTVTTSDKSLGATGTGGGRG